MSASGPSRRTVLAGLSTIALGALAGCSSLPGGNEDGSGYRNWLYDQRDYTDEEIKSDLWFESPSKLVAAEEHLHEDMQRGYVNTLMDSGLDPTSVEWAMLYHNELLATPAVRAFGGSFDANTAREVTAAYGGSVDDSDSLGTVDEYELVAYDDDRFGISREGEAVNVYYSTSEDIVRDLVGDRAESPSKLADSVQQLIDRIGFGTTTSVSFETADGTVFTGSGFGYTVDGGTTAVRYAHLNGDMSLNQLREFGDDIDALFAVNVDEEGPIRWLEGTVDTDRTALDGRMFYMLEAPFE